MYGVFNNGHRSQMVPESGPYRSGGGATASVLEQSQRKWRKKCRKLDDTGALRRQLPTPLSWMLLICFGREELSWEECGSAGSGTRTEVLTLLEDRRLIERRTSKGEFRQRYKPGWMNWSINRWSVHKWAWVIVWLVVTLDSLNTKEHSSVQVRGQMSASNIITLEWRSRSLFSGA